MFIMRTSLQAIHHAGEMLDLLLVYERTSRFAADSKNRMNSVVKFVLATDHQRPSLTKCSSVGAASRCKDRMGVMVSTAILNTISVLFVEETGVTGENHRSIASH
jgi:hypothetical protein